MTTQVTNILSNPVIVEDGNFKLAERKVERNVLLSQSDRYMISDFPTNKKLEWEAYRQALRDLDFSDLDNLTWPIKPE